MFKKIKKWYKQGLWTVDMINAAVSKGVLTVDEAKEILQDK